MHQKKGIQKNEKWQKMNNNSDEQNGIIERLDWMKDKILEKQMQQKQAIRKKRTAMLKNMKDIGQVILLTDLRQRTE